MYAFAYIYISFREPIPGWSKYLASNTGLIKNFWTDKILKLQINNGYYSVCLSGDGDQITYLVHRLIAITFHANPENLPEVDHIDENKLNKYIDHLLLIGDQHIIDFWASYRFYQSIRGWQFQRILFRPYRNK